MNPKTSTPLNSENLVDSLAPKFAQRQKPTPAEQMVKKAAGPKAIKPIPDFSEEFKARFFANIPNGSPSECWEWLGHRTNRGYGTIKYHQVGFLAHRIALYLARKPAAQLMHACHRCDNPLCCNPAHLFWGTHKDNMDDMNRKNRCHRLRGDVHPSRLRPETRPRGDGHALAKLNTEQVLQIRELSKRGITQHAIAKVFSISRETISAIVRRKIWTHI